MQFLIDFKNDADQKDIDKYLADNDCTVVKTYVHYDQVYLVTCDKEPSATDIVESVVHDDASPIKLLGLDIDLDPDVTYGEFDIHDDRNWWKVASILNPDYDGSEEKYPVKGKNITVYLMDSGIDATHPEFADAAIRNIHSFTDTDFTDNGGHGTALASLIVGKTCGLTNATLGVVKIFDKNKATLQSDLLNAFDAIIADFTANNKPAAVLNMSWSIDKNEYIEQKIAQLINFGVYAVCSSGNAGIEIDNVTPASMDEVITIGSYGQNFTPSDFSNYTNSSAISLTGSHVNGGALDGWAPGENIYIATPGGGYGTASGTSLSAAIHASCIAYNLSDLIVGDSGQIAQCYKNQAATMVRHVYLVGFDRRDVLILSDKYKDSVNVITTFKTKPGDFGAPYLAEQKIHVSDYVCLNLVNSIAIENISSDKDLPTGLTIDNGIISGQIPSITGDWEYFEIDLTLTLRTGGTTPYKIKLWVMADGYDDMTSPTADPLMKLVPALSQDTCNTTSCASLGCSGSCYDCNGTPKNMNCICTGSQVCA